MPMTKAIDVPNGKRIKRRTTMISTGISFLPDESSLFWFPQHLQIFDQEIEAMSGHHQKPNGNGKVRPEHGNLRTRSGLIRNLDGIMKAIDDENGHKKHQDKSLYDQVQKGEHPGIFDLRQEIRETDMEPLLQGCACGNTGQCHRQHLP